MFACATTCYCGVPTACLILYLLLTCIVADGFDHIETPVVYKFAVLTRRIVTTGFFSTLCLFTRSQELRSTFVIYTQLRVSHYPGSISAHQSTSIRYLRPAMSQVVSLTEFAAILIYLWFASWKRRVVVARTMFLFHYLASKTYPLSILTSSTVTVILICSLSLLRRLIGKHESRH